MKKKIFYSFAIVAIFALNLFNLQEEKSQDYEFSNLKTAHAQIGCWTQVYDNYWIGDCEYEAWDCWAGGSISACFKGWQMTCPDYFDNDGSVLGC